MKGIIDTYWINGALGTVGIVLTENEFKQTAYIGVCHGDRQDFDEKYIMDYGSKMSKDQAKGFFGNLVNDETYKR